MLRNPLLFELAVVVMLLMLVLWSVTGSLCNGCL